MKKLTLDKVAEKEYQEIVDIWEDSVRVTHSFLKEEDILLLLLFKEIHDILIVSIY